MSTLHTNPQRRPLSPAIEPAYDTRRAFEARLAMHIGRRAKRLVQRVLWLAFGGIGLMGHQRKQLDSARVRRILVVRLDLLGDVVLTLPAVHALRRAYPHAEIDLLVLKSTAQIVAAEQAVTRVLTFDPGVWTQPWRLLRKEWRGEVRTLLRTLRGAQYDLALSVCGDIASIVTRIAAPRRSFGYAGEAYPFMLTDTLPGGRYQMRQHEVRYVLALAEAAGGIVQPGDEQPRLGVVLDAAEHVRTVLEGARRTLGARGPIVAIHAGARNGCAKRWPLSHVAALATRLARELDALVVLTGAPNERGLAATVERAAQARMFNMVGQTTLSELAALIAASDLCVSGDSGPMHIACAVGTSVVALHGPTDPGQSGPTSPDALVLRRDLWCSPCYDSRATAECRFGNPVCMKMLAPDVVFAAARRQLTRYGRWQAVQSSVPVNSGIAGMPAASVEGATQD